MPLCRAKQDDHNTRQKIANSRVLELLEYFCIASHNITCQEDCVGAFKNLHMQTILQSGLSGDYSFSHGIQRDLRLAIVFFVRNFVYFHYFIQRCKLG